MSFAKDAATAVGQGTGAVHGTKGSARLDATVYDSNGNLVRAYDLKTGNAKLTQKQINHIHSQTKSNIPIIVIRP